MILSTLAQMRQLCACNAQEFGKPATKRKSIKAIERLSLADRFAKLSNEPMMSEAAGLK